MPCLAAASVSSLRNKVETLTVAIATIKVNDRTIVKGDSPYARGVAIPRAGARRRRWMDDEHLRVMAHLPLPPPPGETKADRRIGVSRQGMTRPSDAIVTAIVRDRFDWRSRQRTFKGPRISRGRNMPGNRATRRDETSGEETSARTTHSSRYYAADWLLRAERAPGAKQRTTR